MATGQDIVEDALAEIGVFAAETAIEPEDMQLGIRKLNDMLTEWDIGGKRLGFTPITSEADEVRIDRGLVSAVKYNLAGRLSVPFRKPITAGLAAEIQASSKTLLRFKVRIGKAKVSSTMPKGSGNSNSRFESEYFDEKDQANF